MLRRHAHPAHHVHFSSGFTGWIRWITYWVASRSTNAARTLVRYGHTRVLPFLAEQRALLIGRAKAVLGRAHGTATASPYSSLAEAVRNRGLTDAHG